MQQSSSSIGSLAAALAKAQIELVNPEKSMVETIRADPTLNNGDGCLCMRAHGGQRVTSTPKPPRQIIRRRDIRIR